MRNMEADWRIITLSKTFICKCCKQTKQSSEIRDDYLCSSCHYKTVYIPRNAMLHEEMRAIDFAYKTEEN